MTLLISAFYIVLFTHHSLVRFAPCFAETSKAVSHLKIRVSPAYCLGALMCGASWGVVFAEIIAMMY